MLNFEPFILFTPHFVAQERNRILGLMKRKLLGPPCQQLVGLLNAGRLSKRLLFMRILGCGTTDLLNINAVFLKTPNTHPRYFLALLRCE